MGGLYECENNFVRMKINKIHFFSFICLLLAVSFGSTLYVRADTYTRSVQVQMQVVNSTGPGGGGCSGDCTAPQIMVTSTPNPGGADIVWSATDDSGALSAVFFEYGTSMAYGNTTTITGKYPFYSVSLSGLSPSSIYFFKITAVDAAGNIQFATGSFAPSSPAQDDVLIKATLQGRNPAGAHLNLVIFDPVTKVILQTYPVDLENNNGVGEKRFSNATFVHGVGLSAILKGDVQLSRQIVNVSFVPGIGTTLDFTANNNFSLITGDVMGSPSVSWRLVNSVQNFLDQLRRDDVVNILDITDINAQFNSVSALEDLNKDGIVNVLDITLADSNFNRQGDLITSPTYLNR